mmetsp:Transcript_11401/g.10224  ORF Transcript_11401/g.10224 Transcript_11401/m.10224 type:complete len:83 (+) Transcript_11401:128-376(+)
MSKATSLFIWLITFMIVSASGLCPPSCDEVCSGPFACQCLEDPQGPEENCEPCDPILADDYPCINGGCVAYNCGGCNYCCCD